jgi:hypothetical protein
MTLITLLAALSNNSWLAKSQIKKGISLMELPSLPGKILVEAAGVEPASANTP